MKKQGTEWALGLAAEGLGPQAHLDDGPSPRTGGSRVCAPDAEHPEIKGTLDTAASKRVRSRGLPASPQLLLELWVEVSD